MHPSDDWIDDTARALTEGGAPADFKARVLTRLETTELARGFAWRPAAIATAAALVLVVAWREGTEVGQKPDTTTTTTTSDVRLKADATQTVGAANAAAAQLPPSRLRRDREPGKQDIAFVGDADMPAMENAPPPIEVDDIEARPLDIAPLAEADPMVADDIPLTSIELPPLESTTTQFD